MSSRDRKRRSLVIARSFVFLAFLGLPLGVRTVEGQSLLDRAKKVAEKTSVGKSVNATSLEVEMLDADFVDLEGAGLSQVQVGQFVFGVSGLNIANGKGVRLHVYLYNPSPQNATIPVPDPELFRLVDTRGRTLELLSGPKIDEDEEAGQINVPGLERVNMTMLFGDVPDDPATAILKVGPLGVIENIPVHTGAAAEMASGGANSVWSGNQQTQPASPWQTQQPQSPPVQTYNPPPAQTYTPPPPPSQTYSPPPVQSATPPSTYTPPPPPGYTPAGQANQPPPVNQSLPASGTLSGSNSIRYSLSGGIVVQNTESGTVQCTSAADGSFVVRSAGQWTIEANAQARELGSHQANVRAATLQQSASGPGTLNLLKMDGGLGGPSILTGSLIAQGLASPTGPVSLSADFICQL